MKKSIILLLSMTFCLTNCSKDGGGEEPILLDLPDVSVIDVSQNSEMDVLVLTKDNPDYFYIKANSSNINIPEMVIYHSVSANKDITITYNLDGSIDKVIVDNYTFILRNFNEYKLDVGVIYPSKQIEIFREVETSFNWSALFSAKMSESKSNWVTNLVRSVSTSIDAIPCVMMFTGNAKAGFDCGLNIGEYIGNYLRENGIFQIYLPQEFIDIIDGGFAVYDSASSAFYCILGSLMECVTSALNIIDNFILDKYLEIEDRNDEINLVEGALENGYGDIQVTLTWDDGADIDLHVIDTNNEEIYFMNPYSVSGGVLDVDDVDGYGPENIYWPLNQAPSGNYKVFVHDYADNGNGTTNYTVLINAFGMIKKYTGSLVNDEIDQITEFSPNGFTSKNLLNIKTQITTSIPKN